eukprot:7133961-Prymnesium_polylepis.1
MNRTSSAQAEPSGRAGLGCACSLRLFRGAVVLPGPGFAPLGVAVPDVRIFGAVLAGFVHIGLPLV